MARFLTDEWITAFDAIAGATAALVLPEDQPDLVIQHVVTDVPDDRTDGSERCFHLHLSPGPARVRSGRHDDPTVSFTQTHATATAISSGRLSAQAAFMSGELRLGGRVDRLLAHHGALAAVDDAFAALRSSTEY